ncbi:MAG: DUF3472 domain-containing protein [Phocaeicola sp.]
MKKCISLCFAALLLLACNGGEEAVKEFTNYIPMDGNSYITNDQGAIKLDKNGITSWSDESSFSLFFKPDTIGELQLALAAKNRSGKSAIKVELLGETFHVDIKSEQLDTIYIGKVALTNRDYVEVKFSPIRKTGEVYADIESLLLAGEAATEKLVAVKGFSPYWGRRGPSVHMRYEFPENKEIEYFYNEITVAEGEDVIGSYYMANGFGEGYFGMQVNSESERRVLFSVWSPFDTEDPALIPEEDRIVKLRQGEGVHIGEFGNEGSGGQSFLRYNWKAGSTYKFLLQVKPDKRGSTIYTAYFYATDEREWRLIASFKRPKTDTYYKRPYSFLENFIPNQGYITRQVNFSNQWAIDTKGEWHEITQGAFSYDATAGAGVRVDYAGGVSKDQKAFFLKNCGFFNENTVANAKFSRVPTPDQKPVIDLKALHAIK